MIGKDRDYHDLVEAMKWIERGTAALTTVCAIVLVIYLLWPAPKCDPDPWACFGAGRYEAMAQGKICECFARKWDLL